MGVGVGLYTPRQVGIHIERSCLPSAHSNRPLMRSMPHVCYVSVVVENANFKIARGRDGATRDQVALVVWFSGNTLDAINKGPDNTWIGDCLRQVHHLDM